MTAEQAAGWLGSWIVESGKVDLKNTDVIEKGAGAGRGIGQYTGVRRTAYDKARTAAINNGENPNSIQWQMKYFVQEYLGKHDINKASNVGWTRIFENRPAKGSAAFFSQYFTGSEASGKGYFRPRIPHQDMRNDAAQQLFKLYQTPATTAPAQTPVPVKKNFFQIPFLINEVPQGPHTPLPSPGWNPGMIKAPGNPDYRPSPMWERILPTGVKTPFA